MSHDTFKSSLSDALRAALRHKFGKVPSNAFIAREFNLRCRSAKTISQESIRRWLIGSSVPEYLHMQTLLEWLGIDANQLFKSEQSLVHGPPQLADKPKHFLLPEIEAWNQQLNRLNPKHRQSVVSMIDQLLSFSLRKIEKTYMDFSGIVSSTQAAKAALDASENIPRRPRGNSATYEKTADHRSR